MIDLSKIGRKMFQKSEPVPAVVAIVTQKADPVAIKALRAACGLGDKLTKSEDDGVVTLMKADSKIDGGTVVVRLDRNNAVLVKNSALKKAFADKPFEGTIFADGRRPQWLLRQPGRGDRHVHAPRRRRAQERCRPGRARRGARQGGDGFPRLSGDRRHAARHCRQGRAGAQGLRHRQRDGRRRPPTRRPATASGTRPTAARRRR